MGFIQTRNTETCKKETTFGIGYNKNGKYLITAPEGYTYSKGEVDVEVPGKIDLVQLGFTEEQDAAYNKPMLDGIEYAKTIQKDWGTETQPENFTNDERLVYFPFVDMSKLTDLLKYFEGCKNFELIAENLDLSSCKSMAHCFSDCEKLIEVKISKTNKVENFANTFYRCSNLKSVYLNTDNCNNIGQIFYACEKINNIELTSIENVGKWVAGNAFVNCTNLVSLKMKKWKSPNINLDYSSKLSMESIKGIIDQAITAPENVRSLTLNAAVGQAFEKDPDFAQYQALASSKGITIQW